MGEDIFEDVKDPYPGWPGVRRDPHLLSAFDAAMSVSAPNELGKMDLKSFSYQRVLELPQNYDGNKIFEFPPVTGHTTSKRNGFREGMDRRNDCFLWTSPPSAVRLQATASVLNKLEIGGLTLEMTEKEKHALFQGIASVAHPDKVLNMIRSIKRAAGPVAELSAIVSMQKNKIFRTVQRSLFPGQADKDSRSFVFKMPHEGENSRVHLVNRMRRGGNLEGA
ncbi:hypothetical protein R1sor_015047 [Riccia sorocarpa]|uniref:Uncharacterized protein n=1 Tax=Riccia sorocarpa TaxID=122646 RepID=A0ABD3HBF5_9MARC